MRTRIYFVRHAEAQSNTDVSFVGTDILTPAGILQTEKLATYFKKLPIEIIYSSKTPRAVLTAENILEIKPTILECVKERKGEYSANAEYHHIESFEDLKVRLQETKIFLENAERKHIVVVSHAIFLRAFAAYILLGDALTELMEMELSKHLHISHGTVSQFEFKSDTRSWRIQTWNEAVL